MTIIEVTLIIIGFILLIKGADILVNGASNIAKVFNIPEIVIGLTIVSIGTSMPELVVSVSSALTGHSDMAIGNIVGSNINNLFLILGVCSIIRGLKIKKQTRVIEIPIMLSVTIIFMVFANNRWENQKYIITQLEGLVLLIGNVLFIIYNIIIAKKGEKSKTIKISEIKNRTKGKVCNIPVSKSLIYIFIGIIGLKFGGDLIIKNSVSLAISIGISEKIISLTILAIATSLPELITSVTATIKGETDMAIGNILGSQIFNVLLVIGAASFINPITYSITYNKDISLLIFGIILLAIFPCIDKKSEMNRINGIFFLLIYIIYIFNLVTK